jgi:hypothetical protein
MDSRPFTLSLSAMTGDLETITDYLDESFFPVTQMDQTSPFQNAPKRDLRRRSPSLLSGPLALTTMHVAGASEIAKQLS